jgi:hypothetical protein
MARRFRGLVKQTMWDFKARPRRDAERNLRVNLAGRQSQAARNCGFDIEVPDGNGSVAAVGGATSLTRLS